MEALGASGIGKGIRGRERTGPNLSRTADTLHLNSTDELRNTLITVKAFQISTIQQVSQEWQLDVLVLEHALNPSRRHHTILG